MREVLKRRAFLLVILVTLLAGGLNFYDAHLSPTEPFQSDISSPNVVEGSSSQDNRGRPASQPHRQLTQIIFVPPPGIAGINPHTTRSRNTHNFRIGLPSYQSHIEIEFKKASFYIINIPNTVFKVVNSYIYQQADMPPPST